MHLPNAWGYLVFGEGIEDEQTVLIRATTAVNRDDEEPESTNDPEWPIRMAAMSVYAAQHAYRDKHSSFTSDFSLLQPWLDMDLIQDVSIGRIMMHTPTKDTFDALIHGRGYEATIGQDRLLKVATMGPPAEAELIYDAIGKT
jgi:hypothetical protein